MTERRIVLNDADAAPLHRLVASGGYVDAEDALRGSLKLAALARESDDFRLAAFKAAIQLGREDVAAGRVTRFASADEIAAHFLARTAPARRKQRANRHGSSRLPGTPGR